ncbi:bifunctional 3,4-dihydroxy-2-butanone-4-phosphate synthase/GTP cyclohydrolase II [Corynebacterium accolens]|uniref:bifunctional 3,4-dihydroxy-2-butanone-4-phosphate synthase/GTP cyclohydrolase II n=1 Tax=Corynebacterium accolens TaxID=38284 RepID=UPI002542A088|nr:bifunctional 3,4-dihydroxy-2-butanone-4-phosphate synthase/GTP cyclohydrolase II [Corynebacterium accolens]MDK4274772.1 bifunctional 3,4-dihydroxy-2-butanone-4-phosphate synthase/GTP cyclohydrolase II [Corynebacterium accolens]MDK4311080.1 bifunctional 3,4-dihydroxy-2-butanone-4-phosphate synthase/GTP cyclohydrolase II [Corynebacterium accolens]
MFATEESIHFDAIDHAIAEIAAGKPVIVMDDEGRENEGDLIFAAELATPELVAFMVRYSSGYVCASLLPEDCQRLDLPPMMAQNQDVRQTAYTVTVDAATGSTGISAASRAETIRRLADPSTQSSDFTRPGHVVPLRARPGGVLERDGHTEAAVDLARLAGLRPAGVLCEVVSEEDPTDMARGPELRRFADKHGLALISIAQLIEWRRHHEVQTQRAVETRLPTEYGEFTAIGYRHDLDGQEHIALIAGDPAQLRGARDVVVRVHSECLTGDVFGSRRCDCGPQLQESLRKVQEAGSGVVIYLRGHEGRGIGLVHKLQAYRLQDEGWDTVDANLEQGLPEDAREYSVAGQILKDLGVESAQLLTNNPHKGEGLAGFGIEVSRHTPLTIAANADNIRYLRTKRDRMGHNLPQVAQWDAQHEGELGK